MDKKILEKLFCNKINSEMEIFKYRMKQKTPDQIIDRSYKITCMLNIYEDMVAMSRELDADALNKLMAIPNVLAFLLDKWMHIEDSFMDEIHNCNRAYLEAIGLIIKNTGGKEVDETTGIDEGN